MKKTNRPYQNIWGEVIRLPESTRCKLAAFVDIGEPNFGEDCSVQAGVTIPPGWTFGNKVFIGPGAHFVNHKYPFVANGKEWSCKGGQVGDNASIGCGAVIMPVSIGDGAMIGAGAVVTKDVPAGETWVGNPARPLYRKPLRCSDCGGTELECSC